MNSTFDDRYKYGTRKKGIHVMDALIIHWWN